MTRTAPAPAEGLRIPGSPRILVLRNNDLGDLIVVTPLFEALKRRFPTSYLAAGVGRWATAILEGNPFVDEILPVEAPWYNKYVPQGRLRALRYLWSEQAQRLRESHFDLGIDVLGSRWGQLLFRRSGIPFTLGRSGFAGGESWATMTIPHRIDESVGQNALRFASILGQHELPPATPQIFLSEHEVQLGEAFWQQAERGARRRRWLVAPGSGLPQKSWPRPNFIKATLLLTREVDADVVLLYGHEEVQFARELVAQSPSVRLAPAGCPLREVFGIVAASDALLTNSSMTLHVAAAFSKPALTVLGPAFHSARQHQAVWGHPTTRSLGAEAGESEGLPGPEQAVHQFLELANGSRPR